MDRKRIYISGIFHEGHSFSTLPTSIENFAITRDKEILKKARASNSSLGGAVRFLEKAGSTLIPGLSAVAPPGGPIKRGIYEGFKREIIEKAVESKADGIFLDFHGAMLTEDLDDPEGDLLESLRNMVEPSIPIAIALDLHAHVTPKMLKNATVCLGCKENPHTDYAEAGCRAAQILVNILETNRYPLTLAVWIPLIIGSRMETSAGPLSIIHQLRDNEEKKEQILDISVFNTTAYLDAADSGQCITIISQNDSPIASKIILKLADNFWTLRDVFKSNLPSMETLFNDFALSNFSDRPYIIGDHGDRVLAGTPGDDTTILFYLREKLPSLHAVVPVTDPNAVRIAEKAGIGSEIRVAVGGAYSKGVKSFDALWQVVHLGDGEFVQKGPYLAGEPAKLGPTAVLKSGTITVLATSFPGFTQDPGAFSSNGIDFRDYDVVVSKSNSHFKISFNGIGKCFVADTPGLSNYKPGGFKYLNRRPVYPEDSIEDPLFETVVFDHSKMGCLG